MENDTLTFNLEQYFSRLTLQPIIHGPAAAPMPPPLQRSTLMPLDLTPAGYRRLREMHRFDLGKKIVSCKYSEYVTSHHCPDHTLDFSKLEAAKEEDSFRSLRVLLEHDARCQNDHGFSPYLINNITNLENLLHKFFIRIQAVLETMDTNMHDWSFQKVHRPRSNPIETQSLDPILFCHPISSLRKPTAVKLVIFPLCPWEFAPQDFVDFSTIGRVCRAFHSYLSPTQVSVRIQFDDTVSTEWQSRNWVNADRMWAHVCAVSFSGMFFSDREV